MGRRGTLRRSTTGEREEKYKQEKKKVKMSRPVSRAASSASAGAAAGVQGLQVHLRFDFFGISTENCSFKSVIKYFQFFIPFVVTQFVLFFCINHIC